MEPLYGSESFEVLSENVPSREHVLGSVSNGKATISDIISGVQQGLNDTLGELAEALQDQPQGAQQVLECFEEKTGKKLFDVVDSPYKLAAAIVQRGHIETDTEFYLLKEIMSKVDQAVFKEPQARKADKMLDTYEMSASE